MRRLQIPSDGKRFGSTGANTKLVHSFYFFLLALMAAVYVALAAHSYDWGCVTLLILFALQSAMATAFSEAQDANRKDDLIVHDAKR